MPQLGWTLHWSRHALTGAPALARAPHPFLQVIAATWLTAMLLLLSTAVAQAAPANDDIAQATPITTLPFTDSTATVGATRAPGEWTCDGSSDVTTTVWYVFTPAADTSIVASTVGSDYIITLSVHTGEPGALTQIVCNQEYDDHFQSQAEVHFAATAGTTYFIMVGCGYRYCPGGDLRFSLDATQHLELTIALQGHVPPISDDLAAFIAAAREAGSGLLSQHLVGLNATDIGQGGPGNGVDEAVPMSFTYPAFAAISSAILTVTLTPQDRLIGTDALMVIDTGQHVGNDLLQGLPVGQESTVRINLQNVEVNGPSHWSGGFLEPLGRTDQTPILLDGDLDLVYQDDAIVHSATLTITGTPRATLAPAPPQ